MTDIVLLTERINPDKGLLGGKGASLLTMTGLGMPVPPGFILTTESWRVFDRNGFVPPRLLQSVYEAIEKLEEMTGKRFGSPENPLLVSVRSGAKHSMPGMMDTILNVGVNEEVVGGLSSKMGGEAYAWDTYRRFIKMFASSVYGVHPGEFEVVSDLMATAERFVVERQRALVGAYHKLIFEKTGQKVPRDARMQLRQAIIAVMNSWYNPGAIAFRRMNGIPEELGTAVVVQTMVFGNRPNSGSGVLFTRDIQTGRDQFKGDYLEEAQGEEIVRGASKRLTLSMAEFKETYPRLAEGIFSYGKKLEGVYRDVQDIEFTVEDGLVWLLQTRSAKRTSLANVRIARDLLSEGIIRKRRAFRLVKPADIELLSLPVFSSSQEEKAREHDFLGSGIPVSPGVASGTVVLDPLKVDECCKKGKEVILLSDHIDPNDVGTLMKVGAVVTTRGSASSHMALIMRSAGIPGVVGCSDLKIDFDNASVTANGDKLKEGEAISVNATEGLVYKGLLDVEQRDRTPEDVRNFIKERREEFGSSSWSAALYKQEGSPERFNFSELRERVAAMFLAASKKWRSQKARVIELLNRLFPREIIISSHLVPAGDRGALRKALEETLERGYSNAPRTCHYPEKLAGAPWANGPNTREEIEQFLSDRHYPGKYGGYPEWVADETLEAIVIGEEPRGKMNPAKSGEHFVATISCLSSHPPRVVVNLNFGTHHLRSLERVERTDLVMLSTVINFEAEYSLGAINYQIGKDHFNRTGLEKVLGVLKNETKRSDEVVSLQRATRHLAKQIHLIYPDVEVTTLSLDRLEDLVSGLMDRKSLPVDVYNYVVDKDLLALVKQISSHVFGYWWEPPIGLPYLMAALDEELGLSVLEAQGRFDADRLVWFKLYGAKGAEEKEKIESWRKRQVDFI